MQLEPKPTVIIYKATQKGKEEKFLQDGFQAADFPLDLPLADGKCYFAAPDSRSLAEEYNKYYKDEILEVTIDQIAYDRYLKLLERPYQGGTQIELPIPPSLFFILNQSPKVLKQK